MVKHNFPATKVDVGSVLTLPATGSEWNNGFVISRRATKMKCGSGSPLTFPVFSLLDPNYTMTLPVRQLRNGVYDAITHCIDLFLTGQEVPMMDGYWITTFKELVDIGPEVVKPGSSLELHERLMVACSFALNLIFTLGKEACGAIHAIGHMLTVKYNIDHGASLSIVGPTLLETQLEKRKNLLAKSAEGVFEIRDGTTDEKARAFIQKLREFIVAIGLPTKVSDWEGVVVQPGDVEEVVDLTWTSVGKVPFGWRGCITHDLLKEIIAKVNV
jgi:alcohol dehydrogenase YqhD (iron-dependent ADH family)